MKLRAATAAMAMLVTAVAGASPATAIVNGTVATDAGPHVALAWVNDTVGNVFCSGTVIGQRWVLTAAHCGAERTDSGELKVIGGVADVFTGTSEILGVTRVIPHPAWNAAKPAEAFDVALLELASATSIPPASLPTSAITNEDDVIVWGFGKAKTDSSTEGLGVLRYAVRTVYEVGKLPGTPFITLSDENQMCSGDSGGAVTQENVVVGVNSFIFAIDNRLDLCAPGNGAGHAPVFDVVEWITEETATPGSEEPACRGLEQVAQRIPASNATGSSNGRGADRINELLQACDTVPTDTDEPGEPGEPGDPEPGENIAPVITEITISPLADVGSDELVASSNVDLTCVATATDPDGDDDELTYRYEWIIYDFNEDEAYWLGDVLPRDETAVEDLVVCQVTVSDGVDEVEGFATVQIIPD